MLGRNDVKAVYDRLGQRQDHSASYEDVAIADLVAHADFAEARRVFELGCGTGRVAADLLARRLPVSAAYYAVDLSSTMTQLATARLSPWPDRTLVARASGFPHVPLADASVDRFVSMYVLDIFPTDEIHATLAEARRVLQPRGRLCLISLTYGATPYARLKSWGWSCVYAVKPQLLGGCRPIRLRDFLDDTWSVEHLAVTTARGLSSEVVVATPR